ncbi:MAG: hypothetical protein VX768_09520 [Planctomycetota bacterium]|nr:hypothetical protein [Planctomycetota bacterium]
MKTTAALFLALLVAGMVTSTGRAEESFPYTMVVSRETADVLSGPGKTHYATDRLPRGTKVEIYRHDPGGYYAVRPPKGSFSLVLASAVTTTGDPGVVEVKKEAAKAWVGSRLSGDFKPMWQLKLKVGELLSVVRKVEIAGAHSSQTDSWYQVDPPRGEFRWIHKDDLGSQAPASVSTADLAGRQLEQAKINLDLLKMEQQALTAREIASTQRSGWKVIGSGQQTRPQVSVNEAAFDATLLPSGFDQQLESLDLALTQLILGPKTGWQLETMEVAVEQLRKQARTGEELARANRLAQKIVEFQQVKADALAANLSDRPADARLLTPELDRKKNNPAAIARYDGEGVLRKLYSTGNRGKSLYALEDQNGKVVKTISPSSGLNLERYVGQSVGLYGRAGYNQRLNRPHLTASRVVDLRTIR